MAFGALYLVCVAARPDMAVARNQESRSGASGKVRTVTDGDTFRLESEERIRIADIDAPETRQGQARCQDERRLGEVAKARLKAMIEGKTVHITRVGRSYNRTVARVRFAGRDLATSLVARRDAAWWLRSDPKPRWCAKDR